MKWRSEWWNWRKERKILTEQLQWAQDRVSQLQRYQAINSQLLAMYLKELQLAHAALRRKGKALKMLHKQRQVAREDKA